MSLAMNQPFVDALPVLNALPGNHLILLPDAPHFTVAAATDAYLEVIHMNREAVLGNSVFDVFTSDVASIVANLTASLHQVVLHKQPHQMADRWHGTVNPWTGDAELNVWKLINRPVLDGNGDLRYIIHTVEDITNSVQLMEVTEANQYLQTIINLFKEPMQVLQPVFVNGEIIDFRFRLVNQAYAAYASVTPQELQGKQVGEVFPGYVDTVSFTKPVETYKTGQPLTFDIHYDKDGLNLYNRMSTFKLDEEVIIHFTDFTQVRQLQLQLENKIEELKRSNDNLQQFAYVASHDLQEPLRKIQQFGDLLKTSYGEQPGDGLVYLERIQSAAGRMSTLIRDLLNYSRLTAQPPSPIPVNLSAVLQTVLADLDMLIGQTEAVIEVDTLPTVLGEASQLGQLFQNLIANALKFRRPDVAPHIRIECKYLAAAQLPSSVRPTRTAEQYYCIAVADNGVGFEEKHADRIFQVFQRLHSRSQYEGTGIGLAICQKVAANHGGAVTASSQPGQGATFRVYLPA